MSIQLGDTLPSLLVTTTTQAQITLVDLVAGRAAVIYFYPKDATPACTTEAQDFRDLNPDFDALNCVIIGVSRDSVKSHEKFKANECLSFELISDVDEAVCRAFDVIKLKNMYGKQVLGIERSTFFFNAQGQLAYVWPKVKAQGHAAAVLNYVRQYQN
jgi:peroxiredoxin Q/BCP